VLHAVKIEKIAPSLFVVFWSTGFIIARYGTRDAGPFTFLAIRMVIAAVLLWCIATVMSEEKLRRHHLTPLFAAGILMHACYLGGVFYAASRGLSPGVAALLAALPPVVTAVIGHFGMNEKMTLAQWSGLVLGMAGVLCVVIARGVGDDTGITVITLLSMLIAIIGMSIGTLLQRARGQTAPLVRGTAVQYVGAATVLIVVAIFAEGWDITYTTNTVLSMLWAVGVLSLSAILLMNLLLKKQAASHVNSLFFLTPALSVIQSYFLFDEELTVLAVTGFVVAVIGVRLVTTGRLFRQRQMSV
jgi:drug/metabolite transporter (DMT)-like permease